MAVSPQETLQAHKLSRYRSTRQNAAASIKETSGTPPTSYSDPSPPIDTIQRSRSRYRRTTAGAANKPSLPTDASAIILSHRPQTAKQPARSSGNPKVHTQVQVHTVEQSAPAPPPHRSHTQREKSAERLRAKASGELKSPDKTLTHDERARLDAKRLMEKEAERQRKLKERMIAQDRVRRHERDAALEREAEETAAANGKRQEAAQQGEQEDIKRQHQRLARNKTQKPNDDNHKERTAASKPLKSEAEPGPRSPRSNELLGVFRRHRDESTTKTQAQTDVQRTKKLQPYSAPFQEPPPPPKNTTNGMDAPVSAVNSGDRQVWIETHGGSLFLSVTPTTTPVDLMRLAANALGDKIDARSSVLMESFGKVGVKRPLRKYEHVRDVMNSWDDDRQNSLLLVPSGTNGNDVELETSGAPTTQPEEFGCQLTYSQRPGKWDKRWITLRSDGQVTVAKKSGMKQTDQTNMCHLSDFDIYTPAPKQLTRKIKPPKKHCFAIKSQQKSNIFASMESYVHFLCTSDKKTASAFYRAVQGWRSWYLVNVLGEGQSHARKKSASGEPRTSATVATRGRPSLGGSNHRRVASDESHYKIGSFQPLIDLDSFNTTTDSPEHRRTRSRSASGARGQGFSFAAASGLRTSGRGAAPPSAFPTKLPNGNTSNPTNTISNEDSTFAPTSLLGRTYSKRQADAQARDSDRNANAFKPNHDLLKSAANTLDVPHHSLDHTLNTSSDPTLKRSSSQRKPAKPLVDLTPQYREPPQFANRGKGYHPDQIGARGLVESATSPEDLIGAPPANDWTARRPNAQRPMPSHSPAAVGATGSVDSNASPPRKKSGTMTGGTRVQDVWEKNGQGMGLQPGSLLDQVRKSGREHFDEGPAGMRWDRSRAEEKSVAYGEGV